MQLLKLSAEQAAGKPKGAKPMKPDSLREVIRTLSLVYKVIIADGQSLSEELAAEYLSQAIDALQAELKKSDPQ